MVNKKIILLFPIFLLISSLFALVDGWVPDPPDNMEDEFTSMLEITKVIVDVDGDEDTITNNGEKIGEAAKEESNIEFEVAIKNLHNQTIEDVEITVTIKDIDDGDDLEEDADAFDLDSGESDSEKVEFDLPLKLDDGNYDVGIHVEGEDQDGKTHEANWKLTLEVKKDKHKISITKASLSPSTVECSRTSNLNVEIINIGREEEDEVKIEVKNEFLGIDLKQEGIELDEGSDDDAEYQTTFRLNIPSDVEEGTYPIQIKVYYDSKVADTKNVNLVVGDCKQVKQKEELTVKTLPPTPTETLGAAQQKTQSGTKIEYTFKEPLALFLTIVFIIVAGILIFLIGAVIIKLKK